MLGSTTTVLAFLSVLSACAALPTTPLIPRQATACFIVGNEVLPEEVADVVASIEPVVSCANTKKTSSGVPDVTSGNATFSNIDFSQSNLTPLDFALREFATAKPLADTNLAAFQDMLNVYLATEAGIRSVGGNLAIKVPKFFLQMQISRIQTAQGNPPEAAGQQVDHLAEKVTKNAAAESKDLLDEVTALAVVLE